MRYRIAVESDFVSAELFDRRTPEETQAFLAAVTATCLERRLFRVLISVRSSRPIFRADRYGLASFIELATRHSGKIAVLADSIEGRIAQDYAAMLARLRGVNVRTFRERTAAIQWLTERRAAPERWPSAEDGPIHRPATPARRS